MKVRKAAENRLSSSTRGMSQMKRGRLGKLCDVTKFQEEIKITQKTAATPHAP